MSDKQNRKSIVSAVIKYIMEVSESDTKLLQCMYKAIVNNTLEEFPEVWEEALAESKKGLSVTNRGNYG